MIKSVLLSIVDNILSPRLTGLNQQPVLPPTESNTAAGAVAQRFKDTWYLEQVRMVTKSQTWQLNLHYFKPKQDIFQNPIKLWQFYT